MQDERGEAAQDRWKFIAQKSTECLHLIATHLSAGTVHFHGNGSGAHARQKFVDDEPYRAARKGRLIVDKMASRRRFESWGTWAQDRIQVRRGWSFSCALHYVTLNIIHSLACVLLGKRERRPFLERV